MESRKEGRDRGRPKLGLKVQQGELKERPVEVSEAAGSSARFEFGKAREVSEVGPERT